jgi:uncharacterized membrane protein YjgN (DUF898 family)
VAAGAQPSGVGDARNLVLHSLARRAWRYDAPSRSGRAVRFAARRCASRETVAMIVSAGLAAPWVGRALPSATKRLGSAQTRWSASQTDSSGRAPMRAPPIRWA